MTWHGVIVLSQYLVVPSEPDITTSHLTDESTNQSTKPPNNGGQVAGYNPAKDAGQVIGYVEPHRTLRLALKEQLFHGHKINKLRFCSAAKCYPKLDRTAPEQLDKYKL